MEQEQSKGWFKRWRTFLLTALAVCAIWAGWRWVAVSGDDTEQARRGQIGDAYGPLNVLFSALAFAALFSALKMQREELELQSKELKLTRDELKATTQAQNDSVKALLRQAELLRATGELNAVLGRIANYNDQIDVIMKNVSIDPNVLERMKQERESLRRHLDQLLKRFAQVE